jgi:hypothetical protein
MFIYLLLKGKCMKIFDFKNPKHLQILKEELERVKYIMTSKININEEIAYNEDSIWAAMTNDERLEAISLLNNEDAEQYANEEVWDNIPDDITDNIDISEYQLANDDRNIGRVMLRGIQSMKAEFKNDARKSVAFTKLINGYCKKIGKQYDQLNTKQAVELNKKVGQLKQQFNPPIGISGGNNASADYGKGPGNWTGD